MGLTSLASANFQSVLEGRSEVILSTRDYQDTKWEFDFVFQYFPETISDSKQVTWSPKEIPGGSLPLYSWSSSGARSISFEAAFSCDVDHLAQGTVLQSSSYEAVRQAGIIRKNPDIRTVLAFLRGLMLPQYVEGGSDVGVPITYPPRKLRLFMPNTGIGYAGGYFGVQTPDSILCIMQLCEINYQALFPSGLPRYVTVNFQFDQICQLEGEVIFPQAVTNDEQISSGFMTYPITPRRKGGDR